MINLKSDESAQLDYETREEIWLAAIESNPHAVASYIVILQDAHRTLAEPIVPIPLAR
jgi:hypothetical protein